MLLTLPTLRILPLMARQWAKHTSAAPILATLELCIPTTILTRILPLLDGPSGQPQTHKRPMLPSLSTTTLALDLRLPEELISRAG